MSGNTYANHGGAANHSGVTYQDRVSAWFCVQILAERESSASFEWPADSTLDFIRCETEHPVDDIFVSTSQQGFAFINVKHSVTADQSQNSAFAAVLSQFVKQFLGGPVRTNSLPSQERPLDPILDRLVLVTSPKSSSPIKNELRSVLERARNLTTDQRLEDAAKTEPEKRVLRRLIEHLQQFWLDVNGSRATERELASLLSLVRIQVLDVDAGGAQEREAKNLLRASVLQHPEQAELAWTTLTQTCAHWASHRNGGSRHDLQDVLLHTGIALKVPHSFRNDIERLKDYSALTFQLLRPLSLIEMGSKEVKIQRPASQALRKAAEQHSLVLVGEPGAGKSGVLHDLVEQLLHEENRDVVFLAVDRLEAQGLRGLREELGLEHDVTKALSNWTGTQPGFLVIDALDAARSPATAQTFYDLLIRVQTESPRWRVITSIRQYDLRYNTKLQNLFKGSPPSQFYSREFPHLCHLNVAPLDENAEWSQIRTQSAVLGNLFDAADPKLRELLLVPFNVRLMADLLGRGIAIERLTPIRTRIELLDLYWKERVAQPLDEKDAREILLTRAVQGMVRNRSLRINRRLVATVTSDSQVLKNILNANVLSEWQPIGFEKVEDAILTFAHHVVYDYAVARLLLRGVTRPLVDLLEDDCELIITIHPSLIMHFEHERLQNLDQFWELIFAINHSQAIPEIGKLIGPSIAAEAITEIEEFSPLIRALSSTDSSRREAAEKAFRHLTGALTVKGLSTQLLVGPKALNWGELLNHCTTEPRAATIYSSRPALHLICDHSELMTKDQSNAAGFVSRRLLDFALAQRNRDKGLVMSGIETVCRTYKSDPKASGAILRRCLEPEHVLAYGHEELFWLANEVERLIPVAPEIVEEIYRAAFMLTDSSEEKTDLGMGRILAMTSTRRQDFESARYSLASEYSKFIDQSPFHAIRALIPSVTTYADERHSYRRAEESQDESFDFYGRQAFLRADGSEMWDEHGGYGNHEELLQMVGIFQNYLEKIGSDDEKTDERKELVNIIVEENRTAAVWRRLMEVATKHPQKLGLEIRPLCWALPILTCNDTTYAAGNLLKAVFSLLTDVERERVERTILSISELADDQKRKYAERRRNQLLGCLDLNALITNEARVILSKEPIPQNEPRFYPPTFSWEGTPTDAENLRGRGVLVEEESNDRLLSLMEPAKSFASKFANSSPPLTEVQEIIPALQLLHTILIQPEGESAHEHTRDLAWGYLAEACHSLIRCKDISCEMAETNRIKAILLEAAGYPDPSSDEVFENFDQHPSWGSPATRIEAAAGIMHLASRPSCLDEKLVDTIERLSNDLAPPVRFQIAARLVVLNRTSPELMWRLLEHFSREESSRGVLQFLLAQTLHQLAAHHAHRIAELVRDIWDRIRDGAGADEVQKQCANIFAGLYVWQNEPLSRQPVSIIVGDPASYSTEAHQIVFNLRFWLNLGPVAPANIQQNEVRHRAFDLLQQILQSTLKQTLELETKYQGINYPPLSETDQNTWRDLAHLANSICMQVYFASGAYRDNGEDNIPRGEAERRRFWQEARPVLEMLAEFSYPRLTHHLVKTLEYLISFDPDEVFLLVGKVIKKGREGGYQYESLAMDLIVRLVERFIAEYPNCLQENKACLRTLIEILDTFVEAGWPAARRLTYRMEDIFR